MKKTIRLVVVMLLSIIMFSNTSCIFETKDLQLNVPLSIDIDIEGMDSNIFEEAIFDLNKSSVYKDNKDNLKEIKFLEAAFRVKDYKPEDLSGELVVTLQNESGITIFEYEIARISTKDYLNKPIVLKLGENEIQAMNAYIEISGNTVFKAIVEVNNITDDGENHVVNGVIDILFSTVIEAE